MAVFLGRRFDALINWLYERGVPYERQMSVFLILAFITIFVLGWVVPVLALGLI
jgi:hypothetical protein